MEQQTRRERKKEETRQKLLDVSFRLFVEQGYDNTTVDQITERADIGKGTFYNYFPSKEAILHEFMENLSIQRSEKIWAEVMALQDTRQRLARTYQSLAAWFEEYPELIRVYQLERVNTKLSDPLNYRMHFELFIAEVLKMGQEMGDIRDDIDVMEMVDHLMGITMMIMCRWFESGAGQGLYRLYMRGVDFFLIGALSAD